MNDYIKFILHLKLLSKGYGCLIAACLRPANSDSATIIISCGGMGKSTTLLNLFKKTKGKYYSDDTLIISKDKVYSYPANIRVRKFGFTILHHTRNISVNKYFSREEIAESSSSPSKIFFLEKSDKNNILKIESSDAVIKALVINRKIIPYYMERSILGYCYCHPLFNLYRVMKEEEDILRNFLGNTDCYVLQCKEARYWTEALYDIINQEV